MRRAAAYRRKLTATRMITSAARSLGLATVGPTQALEGRLQRARSAVPSGLAAKRLKIRTAPDRPAVPCRRSGTTGASRMMIDQGRVPDPDHHFRAPKVGNGTG